MAAIWTLLSCCCVFGLLAIVCIVFVPLWVSSLHYVSAADAQISPTGCKTWDDVTVYSSLGIKVGTIEGVGDVYINNPMPASTMGQLLPLLKCTSPAPEGHSIYVNDVEGVIVGSPKYTSLVCYLPNQPTNTTIWVDANIIDMRVYCLCVLNAVNHIWQSSVLNANPATYVPSAQLIGIECQVDTTYPGTMSILFYASWPTNLSAPVVSKQFQTSCLGASASVGTSDWAVSVNSGFTGHSETTGFDTSQTAILDHALSLFFGAQQMPGFYIGLFQWCPGRTTPLASSEGFAQLKTDMLEVYNGSKPFIFSCREESANFNGNFFTRLSNAWPEITLTYNVLFGFCIFKLHKYCLRCEAYDTTPEARAEHVDSAQGSDLRCAATPIGKTASRQNQVSPV